MMNKAMLIGNLTKDPETRVTQTGIKTCSFTLAVQRNRKNAQGIREADFISVVTWRQLAELCERYLSKGRKVGVFGSIQTRSYEAKDGTKRYITEVVADEVEFLTPKGDEAQNQNNERTEQTNGDGEFIDVNPDDLPF